MKVFISGTQHNSIKDGRKWGFPDGVQECLDKLIRDNVEVLIGDNSGIDCLVQEYLGKTNYRNVKIYVSGSKKSTRHNAGNWEEKHFRCDGKTMYSIHIEKDFRMAEDAEEGLAIWNGDSKETFVNMLCLVSQDKPCRLYLIEDDGWVDIKTVEDLKPYVGEEGVFSEADIREVMEKCGFSEEMIVFSISEGSISPYELIDIVCRAPISLDEKSYLLSRLGNKQNFKYEAFISVEKNMNQGKNYKAIKHDIRALADFRGERSIWTTLYDRSMGIRAAKNGLYSTVGDWYDNNPLILFDEWYDTDESRLKSSSCGLFSSLSAVERYIENEEYDNDTDEGYYRMEAWDAYDTKWENPRYDYYYYQGKICWFEKLVPEKQEHGNTYFMSGDREFANGRLDLSFMTPYKPGDIVLIDCRPFGPPFHAMILEARDQWDCCFPNIVFQYPGTNEWSLTPLKHRRLYKDIGFTTYEPMLSPIYRLRRIKEEELTEEDDRLLELSKAISGNEEKASEVWENWDSETGDSLSWEKVLEAFAR